MYCLGGLPSQARISLLFFNRVSFGSLNEQHHGLGPSGKSLSGQLDAMERVLPWLQKMKDSKKSAKSPNKRLMQRWPYSPLPIILCRKQVAAIFGVDKRTISRAWECGDLQRVQAPGTTGAKGYRVPLSSVEDYCRKNGCQMPWLEGDAA